MGTDSMDILDFVNSKDIAEYLRSIGYELSAYEMAYLIHENRTKALTEKLSAMKSILERASDCQVQYRDSERTIDSTHDLIKGYTKLMEQRLADFPESDGFWFAIERKYHASPNSSPLRYVDAAFYGYEDCMAFLREEIKGDDAAGRTFDISKLKIGSDEKVASIGLNHNLEPLLISDYGYEDPDGEFELMLDSGYVKIPIPFHKGDIVIDVTSEHTRPFVFTSLQFWDSRTLEEHGTILDADTAKKHDKRIKRANERNGWDCSHMVAMGYESGCSEWGIPNPCMIWEDEFGVADNYLNLAYCRRPLTGAERILEIVSQSERGNLGIEGLVNATIFLTLDSATKGIKGFLDANYNEKVRRLIAEEVKPNPDNVD